MGKGDRKENVFCIYLHHVFHWLLACASVGLVLRFLNCSKTQDAEYHRREAEDRRRKEEREEEKKRKLRDELIQIREMS